MKYIGCCSEKFISIYNDRDIVLWGAGRWLENKSNRYKFFFERIENNIKYIVDSNHEKREYEINGKLYNVFSPDALKGERNIVIIITLSVQYILEVVRELEEMQLDDSVICTNSFSLFKYGFDLDEIEGNNLFQTVEGKYNNNKIIHCCWLSGEKKPEKYQKCIDSWKKICPDYEIMEWTTDNYDIEKNKYAFEAYKARKWAFASDFIRLDSVYEYGGIYLDMDVEVFKPLDDLLKYKAFFAFDWDNYIDLGTSFGALPGDSLVKKLLDLYENMSFINDDGSYNMLPQPQLVEKCLVSNGLAMNGKTQIIDERLFLAPKYLPVFDEFDISKFRKTGLEYVLHWHNAGWFSDDQSKLKNDLGNMKDIINDIFKGAGEV